MLEAAAHLETANGQRYLVQLCKHFAHKIEVSYTEHHGECQFPRGRGLMHANESGMTMVVTSNDEQGLAQTQSIIESHLVRFAFREDLQPLNWQRREKVA